MEEEKKEKRSYNFIIIMIVIFLLGVGVGFLIIKIGNKISNEKNNIEETTVEEIKTSNVQQIIESNKNEEKIHDVDNIINNDKNNENISNTHNEENKQDNVLYTNELKEFFELDDDSEFVFGMDKENYGFTDDFWGGCSVWCAIDEYTAKETASSTLKSQGSFSYEASNIANGSRKRAWIEGVDGYGVGEYVELKKMYQHCGDDDIDFLTLCIVNGYAETVEKWNNNSRVKKLKMYLNEEYVATIELKDSIKPQYIDIKSLGLKAKSGEECTFKFEIEDVYKGEKYDDTAITGIDVEFWCNNH